MQIQIRGAGRGGPAPVLGTVSGRARMGPAQVTPVSNYWVRESPNRALHDRTRSSLSLLSGEWRSHARCHGEPHQQHLAATTGFGRPQTGLNTKALGVRWAHFSGRFWRSLLLISHHVTSFTAFIMRGRGHRAKELDIRGRCSSSEEASAGHSTLTGV